MLHPKKSNDGVSFRTCSVFLFIILPSVGGNFNAKHCSNTLMCWKPEDSTSDKKKESMSVTMTWSEEAININDTVTSHIKTNALIISNKTNVLYCEIQRSLHQSAATLLAL